MTVFNYKYLKTRRKDLRNNLTDAERRLWSRLRARQLQGLKFRRQFGIGRYIVDFYCASMKFAIELDGSQHLVKTFYEEERSRFLKFQDIHVVRYWNNDVLNNIEGVISQITKELNI